MCGMVKFQISCRCRLRYARLSSETRLLVARPNAGVALAGHRMCNMGNDATLLLALQ
jgi:hypothetical protein